MATIRTAISMADNLSPVLRSIYAALQLTVGGFEDLQNASGDTIDVSRLQQAQRELARVDAMFNQIEQEIHAADNAQRQFNNRIRDGTGAMSGLLGKISALIGAYLTLQGLGKVIETSDELTNIKARVQLLVEDMPLLPDQVAKIDFGFGDMSDIDLAQQLIYDAAQRSYSSFKDTANMVSRIGSNARDAFGSVGEVVAFTELVQKQFGIAGVNATEASNATLQLSQALASGVLRGDELNSIFEQAPNLIRTIADYMGEPVGAIRDLAADGEITASIIKNAMFAATDEINAKFDSMPTTWAGIWNNFQNDALRAFGPVLQKINDVANSERFRKFVAVATQALYSLASIIEQIMNALIVSGSFIYDHWNKAEVVIVAATIALGAYAIALAWINREIVLNAIMTATAALRNAWYVATTVLATFATYGFTAAMAALSIAIAANPIAWLIGAVVVLIVLFYLAIAAVNHFAGTSISATGIIAGAFTLLVAVIYNNMVFLWNTFAAVAEFFQNVWTHPIYAVKRLFYNLVSNMLDQAIAFTSGWENAANKFKNAMVSAINKVIQAFNWLMGLLPSEIAAKIGWSKIPEYSTGDISSVSSSLKSIKGAFDNWIGEAPEGYREAPRLEMKPLGNAWDVGYNWGSGLFNPSDSATVGIGNDISKAINDALAMGSGLGSDPTGSLGEKLDKGNGAGKKTADNTKKIADGVKLLNDELKYLRDLAEREAINRYTTAEIHLDARSENYINKEADIDGVIDKFVEKLEEAAETAAEWEGDDV